MLLHSLLLLAAALWLLGAPSQPELAEFQLLEMPKRAVFGTSKKAVVGAGASAVKQGNTLAKERDDLKLQEGDAESIPDPTDEYLVTQMPSLLSEVRIPYPEEARKKGIQGAVVMDLLIDAEGRVRDVKLVSGPGFGLDEAALQAVKGFRFQPAKVKEQFVAVRIRYAYRFILER